jgi:hypothetical protein
MTISVKQVRAWMIKFGRLSLPIAVAFILATCQATGDLIDPGRYAALPAVSVIQALGLTRVKIKTRPLVLQSFRLDIPDNAKAAVIYFPGGGSRGHLGTSQNFFSILPPRQIGIAVIDPPSYQRQGYRRRFRSSEAHTGDIDRVIGCLRNELDIPLWMVGHSGGAISVANAAINGAQKSDGVVFSAADLLRSGINAEPSVTHMNLHKIHVPVLAVAHKRDACWLNHGGSMPVAAKKTSPWRGAPGPKKCSSSKAAMAVTAIPAPPAFTCISMRKSIWRTPSRNSF